MKKIGFIIILSINLLANSNQSFFSASIIHQNINNYSNTQAQSFFKSENRKNKKKSGFSMGFQKMSKDINYFVVNTIYKF